MNETNAQKEDIISKLERALGEASNESIARMEIGLSDLKKKAHRVSELEESLQQKQEIIGRLAAEVQKQTQDASAISKQLIEKSNEVEDLKAQLQDIVAASSGGRGNVAEDLGGVLSQLQNAVDGIDTGDVDSRKIVAQQRKVLKRQKAELKSLTEQIQSISQAAGQAKRGESKLSQALKDQKLRNHALLATIKTLEDKLVEQDSENNMETRRLISEVKNLGAEVSSALQRQQITSNQKIDDLSSDNRRLQAELEELKSSTGTIVQLERQVFEAEANSVILRRALEEERQRTERLAHEQQDLQWKYLMIKSKLEASRASDESIRRSSVSARRRRPSGVSPINSAPLINEIQTDLTRDVKEYQEKTNEFCQQALDAVRKEISNIGKTRATDAPPS